MEWAYQLRPGASGTGVTLSYDVLRPVPTGVHIVLRVLFGVQELQADLHGKHATRLELLGRICAGPISSQHPSLTTHLSCAISLQEEGHASTQVHDPVQGRLQHRQHPVRVPGQRPPRHRPLAGNQHREYGVVARSKTSFCASRQIGQNTPLSSANIRGMTGPDSTPVNALSEPEKDRRLTWRVALAGAAIGLVGIVLGGIIAAASSYYTTRVQVSSQAMQARAEFLRTQEQAAYSRFAGDEATKRTFFIRCQLRISQPSFSATQSDIAKLQTATDEVRNVMVTDASAVDFVGSSEASSVAWNIWSKFKIMINLCISGSDAHISGVSPDPGAAKALLKAIDQERKDLSKFLAAGRQDLQS